MSRKAHSYSPWTLDALGVLGRQVSVERRVQNWTQRDLAERAGISIPTLIAIEKGTPTTAIGTVFEVASLLGIPLVGASEDLNARQLIDARLALLPSRAVKLRGLDDDNF